MKRILHIIALAALFMVCLTLVGFLVLIPPWKYVGNLPRASTILKIEPGMTKKQVVDLLGVPREITEYTFTYSKATFARYPHLWVHFRNGVVYNVYAKEYPHRDWGEDNAVYSYSGQGDMQNFQKQEFSAIF
jgi:hypothetical protein